MDKELLEFLKMKISEYFSGQSVKVYLYGSRARGDYKERSDWDLAFDLKNPDPEFLIDIKENAPTLCGIDAVFLDQAQSELKEAVMNEGKIIYES